MMPLVAVHKIRRRTKAPEYQRGDRPTAQEQKDAWIIQANNENRFKRAFLDLSRSTLTEEFKERLKRALQVDNATPSSVANALPFFHKGDPDARAEGLRYANRLSEAYKDSMNEMGMAEAKRRKWPVFNIVKQDEPPIPYIPTVPVAPSTIEWIRNRSLSRAVELSMEEETRIRMILEEAFNQGIHPSSKYLLQQIQNTVGLTPKQYERVRRRVQSSIDAGLSDVAAEAVGSKFADELRMIRAKAQARTETMDAEHVALQDTWNKANEEGLVPPGTLKEIRAADFSKRTSKLCRDLHGKRVPFDQPFTTNESEYLTEAKMGPPFHPNCRSSMVLIFP